MPDSSDSGDILGFINRNRIFSAKLSEDKTKALFTEECDGYFTVALGEGDMAQIINEFQELMKTMWRLEPEEDKTAPFKDREIAVKALRDILAWGHDITGGISDIAERALTELGESHGQ